MPDPPLTQAQAEADVRINGERLTDAQVMALRVALGVALVELRDSETVEQLGFALAHAYRARTREVERLLVKRG